MEFNPGPLPRDAAVYIAGHRGLVGSAVWRHFDRCGFKRLVGATSKEMDLRDRVSVQSFFREVRPAYVVLTAARVGGIMANAARPVDFLSDNLRIQLNVIDAAHEAGVERLLFLGSSCIYPKHAEQPIREESLLAGPLEPTNDAYAVAKIAGIMHVQAMRRQYGQSFISAMPTNLYGPGDNFDLANSHVLPALIRKFHDAAQAQMSTVTVWGTGTPRREFLHVDDLASACLYLLEHYDGSMPINVGSGADVSISELASMVAKVVGFDGSVEWDTAKPDGTPRKLLDVSRLNALGWHPQINLDDGIRTTYEWYQRQASASPVRGTSLKATSV